MGPKDRIKKLEESLGDDVGPLSQVYIDARNRRTRHLRALMALGIGEELDPEELAFKESYQDSEQWAQDTQIIERYAPPVNPEKSARARERMKEHLEAVIARRHRLGI